MSPFVFSKYKEECRSTALTCLKHDGQQKWFHPRTAVNLQTCESAMSLPAHSVRWRSASSLHHGQMLVRARGSVVSDCLAHSWHLLHIREKCLIQCSPRLTSEADRDLSSLALAVNSQHTGWYLRRLSPKVGTSVFIDLFPIMPSGEQWF